MKQKERTATETSKNKETFDEILYMLEGQKHDGMIKSIIIKENVYHFFMCSPRQIKSIFHFWCCDTETSVLRIDTTFNLWDLWITDSCYKNGRLVHNATGDHPVFLGPLLFHFTKEKCTFTRFALEMVGLNPEITNVRLVQIWMRQFTTVWKQLLLMIVNYIWYDTLASRMKNLINY